MLKVIVPGHCTGWRAVQRFVPHFGESGPTADLRRCQAWSDPMRCVNAFFCVVLARFALAQYDPDAVVWLVIYDLEEEREGLDLMIATIAPMVVGISWWRLQASLGRPSHTMSGPAFIGTL